MIGESVRVPESRCPNCKAKLDAAFEAGGDNKPEPGNVSLCIRCGNWMIFDPDLKLVKPSPETLADIKKDRKCQIAYHATMRLIRRRARQN